MFLALKTRSVTWTSFFEHCFSRIIMFSWLVHTTNGTMSAVLPSMTNKTLQHMRYKCRSPCKLSFWWPPIFIAPTTSRKLLLHASCSAAWWRNCSFFFLLPFVSLFLSLSLSFLPFQQSNYPSLIILPAKPNFFLFMIQMTSSQF